MPDVTMPQLGETVTEGTITKWFKQVGDQVTEDEVLFEVSTDKVDSEVPSPAGGYVTEIRVPEGDTVDVGAVLAVIADAPPGDGAAPAAEPEAQEEQPAPEPEPEPEPQPEPEPEPAAAEPQPQPQPDTQPRAPAAEASAPAPSGDGGGAGKVLSPVVRRLLTENDLDASQITGTGSGGRITRNDVLAVVEARPQAHAAPTTAAPTARAARPRARPRHRRPEPRPPPPWHPVSATRRSRSRTFAGARPST